VSEGSSAAAASNIDTRRVGDAVVSVVSEGELNWDPRFPASEEEARQAIPEADDEGRIWIGLNDVFIRLGDAVIAIDPGLDDPDSSWQRDRPRVWPHMPVTRTAGLAAAMAQLGIAPEEVTHVVITHPHGDHYAGVTCEPDGEMTVRFPRARHVMGRADWEGNAHRGEPETDLERLELVDRLGLLDLVDDRLEIAPGVTVLAAPGESPGHCIVRLESAGEVCLGTQWRQSVWQRPPMTMRSPASGRNVELGPPAVGRTKNRRAAPRLSTGTTHSRLRVEAPSPCQPVLSRWSR